MKYNIKISEVLRGEEDLLRAVRAVQQFIAERNQVQRLSDGENVNKLELDNE